MLQIPDCEINHNAIVVVGYNRIVSIKRLLKSLQEAYYASIAVPLVVSIDKSDCTELYDFVENFEWTHGNKYVIIQEKKRGLKEHIYRCGDLSKFFKSVTILEDDLYVSPFFYDYIEQTVSAYGEDVNVAGISLYRNEHNGFHNLPLYFLNIGHDVFAYQSTSTWGETFTYSMWKPFRKWLEKWDCNFDEVDTYSIIKGWDKAWSKYFEAYLILTNKFFIYPYTSLSTNFSDVGVHTNEGQISNSYQVELIYGRKKYVLPLFRDLVHYDTYAQCLLLKSKFPSKDVIIDLNGNRENIDEARYLLSCRNMPYKIIRTFGMRLRPIELNVLQEIEGNGIYLYDMSEFSDNKFGIRTIQFLSEYYLRSFNRSMILQYFKDLILRKFRKYVCK